MCTKEKFHYIQGKKVLFSWSNFLTSPPQSSISCVCVCLLEKIPFYSGKKNLILPSFNFLTPCSLLTVCGYVCFLTPYYIQKQEHHTEKRPCQLSAHQNFV